MSNLEYPECTKDPSNCPENDGFGCCPPTLTHAEFVEQIDDTAGRLLNAYRETECDGRSTARVRKTDIINAHNLLVKASEYIKCQTQQKSN